MIGLASIVLQIVLEVLRYRREHATALGVKRLPKDEKKKIDGAVLASLKSKNTSDLEEYLKGGDLPEVDPTPAPEAK